MGLSIARLSRKEACVGDDRLFKFRRRRFESRRVCGVRFDTLAGGLPLFAESGVSSNFEFGPRSFQRSDQTRLVTGIQHVDKHTDEHCDLLHPFHGHFKRIRDCTNSTIHYQHEPLHCSKYPIHYINELHNSNSDRPITPMGSVLTTIKSFRWPISPPVRRAVPRPRRFERVLRIH